jgi:hypothetical protein
MAKDDKGNQGQGPKKLQVLVTSVDGNLQHPFDKTDAIGEVREFAYKRLIQQKNQLPIDDTWIELNGQRLDNSTLLSSLVEHERGAHEPDLTLSLAWDTRGGCS